MDPPLPLPDLLVRRPQPGSAAIFEFDLESQRAPACPEFSGLLMIPDFLSSTEAETLQAELEARAFTPAQSGKQKQHHGAKVNFNKRRLNMSGFDGIPGYARDLETKLRRAVGAARPSTPSESAAMRHALAAFETTDVFVLRYEEASASNLDFHIDDTFAYGEAIFDISLESASVMTFIRDLGSGAGASRMQCVRAPLPEHSAALLYGPARYEWEHAILAYDIQGRRTSVTLRTLSPALRRTESGRELALRARASLD